MGHPRRNSKKYSSPKHPWRAERIQEEKIIERQYGLKNKKEIWKAHAYLRSIRQQARRLLAQRTRQSEIERAQLISRLVGLGLLKADAGLDDILVLTTKEILDRRLQTQVYKQGMSSTIKQARQFIIHGHIEIKGKKVTSPSYLLKAGEEKSIVLRRDLNYKAPVSKEVEASG